MQARSSMDRIWDDELARVTQWLSSKKRQREQQERSVFARVNSHLRYMDVQLRNREQAAADALLHDRDAHANGASGDHADSLPEPDLSLDFLGGVSADDIKSLLEAEAARAASDALPVASAPAAPAPVAAVLPSSPRAMAPLAMPTHLLGKASPPKLYASVAKHTHLTPKFVVPSAAAAAATAKTVSVTALLSIALDEDAGVAELMNELELDISDLPSLQQRQRQQHEKRDTEEHKTEESMPPHVQTARKEDDDPSGMSALARSVFGAAATQRSPVVASRMKTLGDRTNRVHAAEKTQSAATGAKPPATGAVDLDQVAAEMHGWVTGYRDPEVIRRKETMSQRSRRQTARFGVSSAEEQRAVLKAAKYYASEDDAGSSASDSEANYESDFSPVDDADDALDDPLSDTELLSDDYLDEGSVDSNGKAQRRRQRKTSSKAGRGDKKKKKSSRKTRAKGKDTGAAVSTGVKATATFYVTPSNSNSSASVERSADEPTASKPAVAPVPKPAPKPVASSSTSSSSSPATPTKRASASATIDLLSSDDDASKRTTNVRTSSSKEQQQQRANGHGQSQSQRVAPTKTPVNESPTVRLKVAHKRLDRTAAAASGSTAAASGSSVRPTAATATAPTAATPDKSSVKKTRNRVDDDDDEVDSTADAAAAYDAADSEPESVSETQADERSAAAPSNSTTVQAPAKTSPADASKAVKATASSAATATPVASAALQVLSEAALSAHNAQHASATTTATGPTGAHANADAASEVETLDFDDIEEDLSDHVDFELDTTRQDDLGFSDESESEAPVVAAPNDDVYEQFFDSTLRKEKLQQREQKPAVSAVSKSPAPAAAVSDSTTTLSAPNNGNGSATNKPKPGNGGAKSSSTRVAASTVATSTATEVTGSNGLRKKVKAGAIATTTVLKGKYQHSRRSIQVIADEKSSSRAGKRSITGVYSAAASTATAAGASTATTVKKNRYSEPLVQPQEHHHHVSSELTLELMSSRSTSAVKRDERYLSYRGSKPQSLDSDDEPLAASVRTPKATNENVDANPKTPVYTRERQMDIYDALHIAGSSENGVSVRDLRDGEYKRPSAFKKVQEEREKRGITFVPREKFLENQPIPKKKKVPAPAPAKLTAVDGYKSSSNRNDKRSSPGKAGRGEKASHYGPATSSDPPPSSSLSKKPSNSFSDHKSYNKSSSGSLKGKGKKFDKFKPRRSPSPVSSRRRSHESESYRYKDSRRHDRSRSPSPRHKDRYKRYRSPSRSWDRSHSHSSKDFRDDKEGYKATSDRSHGESSRKRSRSKSPVRASEPDIYRDAAKRLKPEDPRLKARESSQPVPPPPPPAGALFDGDFGSDMYISDSDDEVESSSTSGGAAAKKPIDIRVDLASVLVDVRLIQRRVYVSGMNGMMDEEVLEELFAPFGIETDRDTGFPAIDVYLCQRSLRPRGDACVTFVAEASARNAVEELNAKIVKNCQIEVRAMDARTQRVLTAQFAVPRESWKCASADCRADVSIWNNKCTACSRKRVFGQSRVRIVDTDWLCSICFTANADRSTACHACNAALPPTNRAQFYSS